MQGNDPFLLVLILPVVLYVAGPLALAFIKSPRASERIAYVHLFFQGLVGLWWIANLFLEWAFSNSVPSQGSSSESLFFGLLFLVALASIVAPIAVWIAIARQRVPRKHYWAILLASAILPLVVRLPAHPLGFLIKELASIPSSNKLSEVSSAVYSAKMSRLKESAELYRKDFESGRFEVACEWFANDPIAPPHKFSVCKKLIESTKDPDLRWKQIDHFRVEMDFKTWFEAQKRFDGSVQRAFTGETAVIPVEEQVWFINIVLSTFAKVSDEVFTENFGSVGRALARAAESGNSRWSAESKLAFANFSKERLIVRAEKISKPDDRQKSEIQYFIETLKNDRKD